MNESPTVSKLLECDRNKTALIVRVSARRGGVIKQSLLFAAAALGWIRLSVPHGELSSFSERLRFLGPYGTSKLTIQSEQDVTGEQVALSRWGLK